MHRKYFVKDRNREGSQKATDIIQERDDGDLDQDISTGGSWMWDMF